MWSEDTIAVKHFPNIDKQVALKRSQRSVPLENFEALFFDFCKLWLVI